MSTVRQAAAWTYRVLIVLSAAVIVEVLAAGLGVFGAMPGEDKLVSHEAFGGRSGAQAAIRGFLTGCSLLVLIAIKTGLRPIGAASGLAVLTSVEAALGGAGEDALVAGAFHAVNAVLVLGLVLFLAVRAWRANLLIPPAQLRRTAPAPMPAAPVPVPAPAPKERVQLGGEAHDLIAADRRHWRHSGR